MIEKKKLEELYLTNNLSMAQIARKLGVSTNSVVWWMQKHKIKRRSWSDATYVKQNPGGDPFKITSGLSNSNDFLHGLGIGLFWGEGNKVNPHSVRLGNTDPGLLKTFIKFLIEICGVKRNKIRFGVQVFNDTNPIVAEKYWVDTLGFEKSHFMPTISIVPPQGKGTYKRKSEYGVVTVYVHNVKLRNWLKNQLVVPK